MPLGFFRGRQGALLLVVVMVVKCLNDCDNTGNSQPLQHTVYSPPVMVGRLLHTGYSHSGYSQPLIA